jgi:hypothetical protein
MIDLKTLITSEKTKGIISLAAAIVMYFTPDTSMQLSRRASQRLALQN